MVIDALNGLKEERFIEGISNKHHTLNEIADMADMVEAYQKRVNIEARRLVEFSEHWIRDYATTNNKCFGTAEVLFKKIQSTLKSLAEVFHDTMRIDRRRLPSGVEAPSVFDRSPLSSDEYQTQLFGLETFPEAVQKLYHAFETLFTTSAQSLALCHQMIEKEEETRNDIVQLRQIYKESCEELLDSVKSVARFILPTQELPENEIEKRRQKAGSEESVQFLKEGYHRHEKEELRQYVLFKCQRECRNNGLTDKEAFYWKKDHAKGLRVRYVVEHFDDVKGVEGQKGSLSSRVLVEFLKWCGVASESLEKELYEDYFKPTYLAKGKLNPLGWNTISGKRKELKETWGFTDAGLVSEFEKLLPDSFPNESMTAPMEASSLQMAS